MADLYEYFESDGTPFDEIEARYGKDALDGYFEWVYFNVK